MSGKPLIVAIDGPSGVGKSTVARGVAGRLGVPYLDTGAMYRCLGLRVLERGVDPTDREAVEALAVALDLGLRVESDGRVEILLDGEPVGERIRTPAVSEATSQVSVHPGVRVRMVELQRRCAQRAGGVLEGRDIGTQVFPDARFKFFLDAPLEVRLGRRLRQLEADGRSEVERRSLMAEVEERDRRDRSRSASPLTCDDSYVRIDTSRHSAEEVVDLIVTRVEGALADEPAARVDPR